MSTRSHDLPTEAEKSSPKPDLNRGVHDSLIAEVLKTISDAKAPAAVVTPEQAAKNIQNKAEAELDSSHQNLKTTTDGSAPRVLAPLDNFKVNGSQTPLDIARDRLGPHATKDQIQTYASDIMAENQLPGSLKKPLEPGTIKLPGQAADGSIYFRANGATYTDWSDGSNRIIKDDGSGTANYRKGNADIMFDWDKKDSQFSYSMRTEGKHQIEMHGDGRVVENKLVNVKTADGPGEEWQKTKEKLVTGDGVSITTEYAPGEKVSRETFEQKDGYKIIRNHDKNEQATGLTIREPDGHRTELNVDKQTQTVSGKRFDEHGKLVETVALMEDKLVYTDARTGARRAESFEQPNKDHSGYKISNLGKYDADLGTITSPGSDLIPTKSSFAPGRLGFGDGSFQVTANMDISVLNVKTGEASVAHADGTGARLNANGTLDRWGPTAADRATGEKLSPTEQKYLKDHNDIDRRDFVEIHRRFHGDQNKIDRFYDELNKIDSAKHLNEREKSAIRQNLMHHVAAPAEIYQGVTPSCNVTVIERDLAITNPAKYVATVVTAVSEGKIYTADSKEPIKLDVNNLKMADSSGRDLASRIFQTAVLHAEFHPAKNYRNTRDGIGRIMPGDSDPKGTKPIVFDGLTPSEIADARYKLTGEEKAITYIATQRELAQAIRLNGGPPVTILVDASGPPFNGPPSDHKPNHIVTITGIEPGSPVKYLVQNQWGLTADHSTSARALTAEELLKNMNQYQENGGPISTDNGAVVIVTGDHTKAYNLENGRHYVNVAATRNADMNNRGRHPELFKADKKNG